jgi:hypothetical protein
MGKITEYKEINYEDLRRGFTAATFYALIVFVR